MSTRSAYQPRLRTILIIALVLNGLYAIAACLPMGATARLIVDASELVALVLGICFVLRSIHRG